MILSIHMPKTGGNTFRAILREDFGPRLMFDYGDLVGYNSPDAIAHRARRKDQMRDRLPKIEQVYDCIHGHFIADKYIGAFAQCDFACFVREPYQQTISQYYFLQRHPEIDHPAVREFHANKMSMADFLAWPHVNTVQSDTLGSVGVRDLAMVGLTEQYARSIALFNARFGRNLQAGAALNINATRPEQGYAEDAELLKVVRLNRAADFELYRVAVEQFAALCARYGV